MAEVTLNRRRLGGLVDKIAVIGMEPDSPRMQGFSAGMARLNLDYTFAQGINGKKLALGQGTEEELELRHQMVLGGFLSHGEVGCLLSHAKLWREVATDPTINRTLIFEDDARTYLDGDTLQRMLVELYAHLDVSDEKFDLLYLGKALDQCISYTQVFGNVYRSTRPLCMHAYIITKTGAQKMLAAAPFSYAADVIPHYINNLSIMVFHPSIFFQDVMNTTSNLREFAMTLKHSTECMLPNMDMGSDTWKFVLLVIIALLAIIFIMLLPIWIPGFRFP